MHHATEAKRLRKLTRLMADRIPVISANPNMQYLFETVLWFLFVFPAVGLRLQPNISGSRQEIAA